MSSASSVINSTNVRNGIVLAWNRVSLALAAVLAPGKAVDTAARLFTTPPRFAHTPPELELLATGTRLDVAAPEGRIAAWRFGNAQRPAIVLSHGWGGRGAQLRAFVPALLDAGYQVVLFDHIAHGSSAGRRATLVQFMQGLDAVVKHLEAEGATVAGMVGHSLGAAAAGAWLNETRREMRIVLVAPPTSVERYSAGFARKLGVPESVRRAMQERFERRYGYRWSQFELPQSVEQIRASALVIHDLGDTDVAPASGLALARAWRGAKFVGTRGLGHRQILRDPTVVGDAVDFLADRVVFAPPPRRGEASAYFAPAPLI
jgi:pimeloyl-ACP methyl ester carboxylesterase